MAVAAGGDSRRPAAVRDLPASGIEEYPVRQSHPHSLSRRAARAGTAPVALGLAVAAATGLAHADPTADARQAACAYGRVIATYDYTHLDSYFAEELDGAADPWRSHVQSAKLELAQLLATAHVRSFPTGVSCAVLAVTGDRAQVAMAIGSIVISDQSAGQPRLSQLNTTFTLRNRDGRWLVSDIAT
jgi:Mce-associated membrane protein